MFKAYLASDHVSEATGKTIAITISKNGGAFGNPNAGATNATEISSGWYKVTLDTTDTNTVGPLAVRGAVATIDDVGVLLSVVKATNGGYTALPDAVADAAGGLPISDAGGLDLDARLDAAVSSRMATYTQPTGFLAATFPSGTVANTTNITAGTITTVTNLTNAPTSGDFTSAMKTSLNNATPAVTVSDKTGFALTTGERTSIANEVEAQIIDDTDSEKVLTAITDKIAAVNPDLSGLTLSAIASAVWSSGTRLLTAGTNIVLAKGTGVTGFNDLSAAQVNAEADTALSDAGVSVIKAKTDQLVFSKTNELDVNIHSVNDVTVNGVGTSGSPWGP